MAAVNQDILIEQGATYSDTFFLVGPNPDYVEGGLEPETIPADLTGYSARCQIRTATNATTATADMTCTVDALAGSVTIGLTAAQTALIPTPGLVRPSQATKYVYTLEIYQNDGYVERISQGFALVTPEATK